jgi:orotate phosphoribosyltransferase
MSIHRDELVALLKELSVRTDREFELKSGRKSTFYVDCKQTMLTARGHGLIGQLMYEHVCRKYPGALVVAGVELGGCPLASSVAMHSYREIDVTGFRERPYLDALYIRKHAKEHGTRSMIEGGKHFDIHQKQGVVLLEDVFTTGGSALAAITSLANEGFGVLGVVALVDREEGAAETFGKVQVKFSSLFTRRDLI